MAREHELIITHGNGPQVGLLALQSLAYTDVDPYPLDVLGAESGGMISYMIEQELDDLLDHQKPCVTMLTQVEVDPDDPAFKNPTKFIGPVYDKEEAEQSLRVSLHRGCALACMAGGSEVSSRATRAESRKTEIASARAENP